jgi:hypothetical protein
MDTAVPCQTTEGGARSTEQTKMPFSLAEFSENDGSFQATPLSAKGLKANFNIVAIKTIAAMDQTEIRFIVPSINATPREESVLMIECLQQMRVRTASFGKAIARLMPTAVTRADSDEGSDR